MIIDLMRKANLVWTRNTLQGLVKTQKSSILSLTALQLSKGAKSMKLMSTNAFSIQRGSQRRKLTSNGESFTTDSDNMFQSTTVQNYMILKEADLM
jgi:hypothetical protein